MRVVVVLLFFFLLWHSNCALLAQQNSTCLSQLSSTLTFIQKQLPQSQFGLLAQSRTTVLYSQNADLFFTPASNTKILTTSALLLANGPDFQFKTPVYVSNALEDAVEFCIVVNGDPSLDYPQLQSQVQSWKSKFPNKKATFALEIPSNDNLSNQFDSPYGEWEWGDLIWDYGAQPSSAMIHENAVSIGISPGSSTNSPLQISILDSPISPFSQILCLPENQCNTVATLSDISTPVDLFVQFMNGSAILQIRGQMALQQNQQQFNLAIPRPEQHLLTILHYYWQPSSTMNSFKTCQSKDAKWTSWDAFISAPLSVLMNHTLQVSDNLYAEAFMKQLGKQFPILKSGATVRQSGVAAISTLLSTQFGVSSDFINIVDGSGLSRRGTITPRALVQTLSQMLLNTKYSKIYWSMLPLAGISGTLKTRFVQYPGILSAKTGTLTGAISLSGYINQNAYFQNENTIVFSIMINHGKATSTQIRNVVDQIALQFAFLNPNC